MAKVIKRNNENFDKLLRRFKRACENDKIVLEARERMFFEKKSIIKKKAKKAAIKREIKRVEKDTNRKKRNY